MSSTSHAVGARTPAHIAVLSWLPRWSARLSCTGEPSSSCSAPTLASWHVRGSGLPLVRRPCPDCATNLSAATGRFRVNANGRLLDIWLLTRCVRCGHNGRLKVHHRVNVSSVHPARLDGYMRNEPDLVVDALLDPSMARRNHYALDWTEAWELDHPRPQGLPTGQLTVQVHFDVPAPIRPVRLIALGLDLSRGHVERMIGDQRITSTASLRRRTSMDFSFTVRASAT